MARTRTRRRNANRNPLYNPSKQLGGKQLKQAAQDLAGLEFAPARQALEQESAQITNQGSALTGRASDYYLQLAREEQGNLDRLAAINKTLGERTAQTGQQTQDAIRRSGEQAGQLAAGSAAGTQGIVVNDQMAAETQAARDQAAGNQQNAMLAGNAGTQAAAAFADQGARARSAQGGETLSRLTNLVAAQQAKNRADQTTVAGQQGAATSKNVLDLRQQGFENLVTQAGLDIKTDELTAEVARQQVEQDLANRKQTEVERNNRRRTRLTRAQIRAQKRGQDISSEDRALDRASREQIAANRIKYGGKKAGKGLSPETIKNRTGITNAQVDIEKMLSSGQVPRELRAQLEGTGLNRAAMNIDTARKIVIALGAPPVVAQAAAELAKYRGLKPSTAAQLRRIGVKVPDAWLGSFSGPPTP